MANMLQDGATFLADELKQHASVQVIVQVGALEIPVNAVKGQSEIAVDDGAGGTQIITTDRDFIVQQADLILAGIATLPERGWRVRETVGSTVEVYEALTPGKGRPAWTWCDEFRKALRMHCKLV